MKHKLLYITFLFFCALNTNIYAQGYRIYGKDKKNYNWNYKDVDSVIISNKTTYKIYKDGKAIMEIPTTKVDSLVAYDSSEKDQISGIKINGHEFVDLGLPSGLLWATCNIGATCPEEIGSYYAWGETEPKDLYTWNTYKWCNGSSKSLTKYQDLNSELSSEDDAANVIWSGNWRMPTKEEVQELTRNTKWKSTTQNGVKGFLIVGQNNNSIFLPYSGSYSGKAISGEEKYGGIWTKTNGWSVNYNAVSFSFDSSGSSYGHRDRATGLPIRPVIKSN